MPLPVERSQGSVSALVARFQTAANRDLEAEKARESRRASLQPSSTSSANNSRRTSSIWSGGIITPSPGTTPKLGDVAVLPSTDDGKGNQPATTEEGVTDKVDDKDTTTTKTVKDVIDKAGDQMKKVENRLERLIINDKSHDEGSPDKDKDSTQIKDGINQSPSRPPKSPKRLSSTNVMSALPIPTTDSTPSQAHPESSKEGSDNKESKGQEVNANQGDSAPVQDKLNTPSKITTSKKTLSQTMSAKKPSSTPSSKPLSKTPIPRADPTPNTNNTTKSRSRLSSGPSSSPNTTSTATPTARARTSLGHQTPTSTSTHSLTKKPTSSTVPPPSGTARTPKPLIPSHTGPARRPSSSAHTRTSTDTSMPSPLKPHLTGTPSKPTASSLAKARIPSSSGPFSPSTPSSTSITSAKKRESLSLGRTNGSINRTSVSGGGRGNSLSPSPSPASKAEKQEGTPSKSSSVSSAGGSRLLQGTAASRARSAGVQHQPHESPSSASTPISSKTPSKTTPHTPSRTIINNNTKTPGRSDRVKTSSSSSTSTSRVRVKSTPQPDHSEKMETKDLPKTPSVGKSPIGRLGLAAANIQRPEGPSTEMGERLKEGGITSADKLQDQGEKAVEVTVDNEVGNTDKAVDLAKEELQDLTTKSDGIDNSQEIDDPIERPKTPSPKLEISDKAMEALPHKEDETHLKDGLSQENEIEVQQNAVDREDVDKDNDKKNEADDEKNEDADEKDKGPIGNADLVEIGDESLEEIPDIE